VNQRTHEQSRWELVAGIITGVFVVLMAVVLIVLALTAPVTPGEDQRPRTQITRYVEA
jgi:hypothetical protein